MTTTSKRDEGFTMIELAIVILIMGILIAFAIPSYLGVRQRAAERSAQQVLKIAATEAFAAKDGSTGASFAGAIENGQIADGRTYSPSNSSGTRWVSGNATEDSFAWAVRSANGKCFSIRGSESTATEFGWYNASGADCTPDNVDGSTGKDWNAEGW
jgi:type IV pilus assembly protein PilA